MTSPRLHASSIVDLPPTTKTRDGLVFDPRSDIWNLKGLSRAVSYNFTMFECFSSNIVINLKRFFIRVLEEKSFSYADNLYQSARLFYRYVFADRQTTACELIELSHILTFKSRLNSATEWKLGMLRILLSQMDVLGFGISTSETVEYLESSTIRGNIKGTSVRTRDSRTGTFVDTELLAIQSALNGAYADGEITLKSFAISWLFLAYGARSIQLAAMKENDLIVSQTDGGKLYALRIPRAKQRARNIRATLNTRYCSKQVGELLEHLIKENKGRRTALGLEGDSWPMFMSKREGDLPNLRYHETSQRIGDVLARTVGRLTALKANARRFRQTIAQRAVDDGKDKYTVAELLDHSDTQNVEVYFEASPAMVLRLDRHLAMEMAPLAQAFAGVVVATESEARRGDDRSSRIYDRTLSDNIGEALGSCGQMSFCGLAAPFACYTCRHFQPWLDGPHEEFMAALIADRERMEADGYSPKIYTIRDRTILATAEVIQLCSVEMELRGEVTA